MQEIDYNFYHQMSLSKSHRSLTTLEASFIILEVSFTLIYDVCSTGITYDNCDIFIVKASACRPQWLSLMFAGKTGAYPSGKIAKDRHCHILALLHSRLVRYKMFYSMDTCGQCYKTFLSVMHEIGVHGITRPPASKLERLSIASLVSG
jgi:hypothetical protein